MTISVVIPLYNEEENVQELHSRLKMVLDTLGTDYEVLFVDDGSTDNTLKFLQEIQAGDSKVIILSLRRNFGQTAAFAAGFDYSRGDIIITMDGDLQNDPNDIPKLIEQMKDNDLVSGWRKKRKDPFLSRRLPSIMANWLISKVTGVKLHDYGCSLKAYKRDVIKNLKLYGEMHRFIPAVASWYGVRIAEVETEHHPRVRGKSKYGISRTMTLRNRVGTQIVSEFGGV
ncbi:MAG: glycosyltransferase family 2 protein, partial [Nitrospirota bacterium]|nr:glycosyltransferase family 2 protein [Nitrospirota bacterium]